jgi:hypothetical protein
MKIGQELDRESTHRRCSALTTHKNLLPTKMSAPTALPIVENLAELSSYISKRFAVAQLPPRVKK